MVGTIAAVAVIDFPPHRLAGRDISIQPRREGSHQAAVGIDEERDHGHVRCRRCTVVQDRPDSPERIIRSLFLIDIERQIEQFVVSNVGFSTLWGAQTKSSITASSGKSSGAAP